MGLRTIELFAGVGGFRVGLEPAGHEIVWWNQWEPATKRVQYAFDCYRANTPEPDVLPVCSNLDISKVDSQTIAARKPQLLVGGFPCQDYSVMNSLRNAHGLRGAKGGLWWQIERILNEIEIPFVLLENVPRLLTSGPRQSHDAPRARGHDFGVILRSLMDLGYAIEWRVIQADDYGHLQRRRRVFIFAAKRGTPFYQEMMAGRDKPSFLTSTGFFAPKFPVKDVAVNPDRYHDAPILIPKLTNDLTFAQRWQDAGIAVGGMARTYAVHTNGPSADVRLGDCILKHRVANRYYLSPTQFRKWQHVKKGTKKDRSVGDFSYRFLEGPLSCPDSLDRSARTILTNEGSRTPNRTTHIIRTSTGKYRFLTPEECEILNEFSIGWTAAKPPGRSHETPDRWRYFMMGNSLIVGLVRAMGFRLAEITAPVAGEVPIEDVVPNARAR